MNGIHPLKRTRDLIKVSQTDLSKTSGEKKSVISDIELGRVDAEDVGYGRIVRIVRALQYLGLPGITADDVFPVRDKTVSA